MKRAAAGWAMALALANTTVAAAQAAVEPSAEPAQVWLTTVRFVLDSLGPVDESVRIWVQPARPRETTGDTVTAVTSPEVRPELERAFPNARVTPASDVLFLCPPGVQVRMPGRGCPIRENGVIVRLGPVSVQGDTLHIMVALIRSSSRDSRVFYSWAKGTALVFVRSRGSWEFVRSLGSWIT
ncbi:MAG: hypothetical protein ACRELX_07200 [Longimicrobiales bacterium]